MTRLQYSGLSALLLLSACVGAESFLPLEFRNIPVNGNDLVADPEGVTVNYGFATRTGSKVVEHGDSITLLDSFTGLETPHVKWAAPYANGPVRVLYVANQAFSTRNALELRQRSDFDVTILQFPNVLGDAPPNRYPAVHEFYWKRFQNLLSRDYEVIFLSIGDWEGGHRNFDSVGDRVLRKVEEKVKAGCGLVLLLGSSRWYRTSKPRLEVFHALSPLTHGHGGVGGAPTRTATVSPVTEALSFALWPKAAVNAGAKADGDAAVLATIEGRPVVATGHYGKGRVVAAYYRVRRMSVGLIPDFDPERASYFGDYYEPVYAFFLKALAWAGGKEPPVSLRVPDVTLCKSGDRPVVKLALQGPANAAVPLSLRYRLQDSLGQQLAADAVDVAAGPAVQEVRLELPACHANGLYRLDLWAVRGGKTENWGSTAIRVEGGPTLALEQLQKAIPPGGTARFRIKTSAEAGLLTVRGVDDLDRVFFDTTTPAADGGVVEVDCSRSCLPRNRIEFSLRQGEHVIARQAIECYLPRIGLRSLDGEYLIASYGSTLVDPHLGRYVGALYREAGLNTNYGNWHHRAYIRDRAASLGLFSITGASWSLRQSNLDKVLKLSPNDPKVREDWKQKIAAAADDIQSFGGIGRAMDDETWFAYTQYKDGETRGAQADQSEHSLQVFRQAMKEKYQTIEGLNAAWDTSFESFETLVPLEEDVVRGRARPPYVSEEAEEFEEEPAFLKKDNPSGWLEFRQYMNWTFAHRYYGWVTEQHQKVLGPDFAAGCGAPHWANREGNPTYRGGDVSELKKVMKFMMLYGGSSEAHPDAFVGQPGGQKYDPPLNWRQFGPWYHLLTGADALWFYFGHAMIGNEIAWRRHAQWVKEGIEDIRNGVGLLVSQATPLNRQVRTLYSSENMAMQWLYAKRKDVWKALQSDRTAETLSMVLSRAFIRSSLVTAEDLRKGDLKDCKLLILSQAINMSDETADAIRQYVKDGGCVIADVMPGLRTRFGKPRTQSALQEVFGVDASAAALHQDPEVWYSIGVGFSGKLKEAGVNPDDVTLTKELIWLPGDVWFLGLKPTTARPEAAILSKEGQESLGCFVNEYGKGKTLLLNFVYCDFNTESSGWHRSFGEALIRWAGLEAPARIVKRTTNASLPYRLLAFRRGDTLLLGSIRGSLKWIGQRPQLIDESRAANFDDQVKFVWKEKRHAYNVRRKEYVGHVTSAEVDLPSFQGRLLALLPYRVDAVEFDTPATFQAGRTLSFTVKIRTSDGVPEAHALRMEVFSPTGYRNLLYCKTRTAERGRADFRIPFANNDRPGKWTITVRDVMTGVEGKGILTLRP